MGCIASELLFRKALFPGKNGEQQLDLITDLVGAPSREDMQSLRSSRVKELLRSMRGKTAADFRAYYPPEADDLELALIKEMLLFSADKRTPAGQAIQVKRAPSPLPSPKNPPTLGMAGADAHCLGLRQHKYFDAIRDLPGAQVCALLSPVSSFPNREPTVAAWQIPYVETPVLDKSEFVFEDAKRCPLLPPRPRCRLLCRSLGRVETAWVLRSA